MKTEPEMPLNVSEFLQDTLGFDNAEIGSYMLLILSYWANAKALPNDDKYLRQIARCPDGTWVRTKGILSEKFQVSNGSWTHARIERCIAESKARKESIARASAAGVQARRDLGQLPPAVQPTIAPQVKPVVSRISLERELERVEGRVAELKNAAVKTATETRYTAAQRAELCALRDRRKQIMDQLGWKA